MSKDFDPNTFLDKTGHFDPDKFAGSSTSKDLGDVLKEKGSHLASGISEAISSITPSAETLKDFGLAAAQGATLGGMDELMGGIAAASEVPSVITGKRSLSDLADIYRQYQQLAQKEFEESEERSPTASTIGGLAGAFVPGVLTAGMGAGASAIAQGSTAAQRIANAAKAGAKLGAVSGALTSKEGGLTSLDEAQKLALDVAGGSLAGGALGAGTQAILGEALPSAYSKAKEYVAKKIEDKPIFRQMSIAKEMGEEGINIGSDVSKTGGFGRTEGLVERDVKSAKGITDKLFTVDKQLGEEVGLALSSAETSGQKVLLSPDFKDEAINVLDSISKSGILTPSQSKELSIISSNLDDLSPLKAKMFIDKLDELSSNLSGDNSQIARTTLKAVSDTRKKLSSSMKESLPDYKSATERFEKFRSGVLEPIVSGKRPSDISSVYLGNLENKEQSVFDKTLSMIQGGTKPGTAKGEDQIRLINFLRGLRETEQTTPSTSSKIQKAFSSSIPDIEKGIIRSADESAMLQQTWGINPQESLGSTAKRGMVDLASTGRGKAMALANTYGRAVRAVSQSKPAEFARSLATAPFEKLEEYANKLIQSGDKGAIGTGEFLLKAIQEKNSISKNAAIFKIMQDPKMRLLVSGEDLENKPTE